MATKASGGAERRYVEYADVISIRSSCVPRADVLKGDLGDAIFAADFGHVVEGRAPEVYQDPSLFFSNTHPAAPLKKVVTTVFDRLATATEAGAAIRLSTGFGGGKTHTLISLWHLAKNIQNLTLGNNLLPAAGRPKSIKAAGIDGEKLGAVVAVAHDDITTKSLWGELAYQLGGAEGYAKMAPHDDPDTAPDSKSIQAILPENEPVLILLDELVKYMIKLSPRGQGALLAFIGALISEVGARHQAVVVISDPAGQAAYKDESSALAETLKNNLIAKRLDEELGRKTSDYDPIGNEAAQVIVRRLFTSIDADGAQEASAEYHALYQRVTTDTPGLLLNDVASSDYAKRIVECYPFHPRLLDTARDRLGALQDFQKSRGTLRLFARILRDVWDSGEDLSLITAGDINWKSERIRADLLQRLHRDQFESAVHADVDEHAGRLDSDFSTDVHRRVASALLLESLPMTQSATMDKREIALATLRPTDVGHEPGEAMDRLISVCWHTYKDETGHRYQFRFEPNVNKLIEERAQAIPIDDARQAARAIIQSYFGGNTFKLIAYPATPRSVADNADLKLVLSDEESIAQAVCDFEDDSDPTAKQPRGFRNAIFGIAPNKAALNAAVETMRLQLAAELVAKEKQSNKAVKQQVDELLPIFRKRARIATIRAFNRVVFQGKPSISLDEKYLVSDDGALQDVLGQAQLKLLLDDKKWIFQKGQSIDPDLLIDYVMSGATPSLDHAGAYSAKALHERALRSDKISKLLMDPDPIRGAILRGVTDGKLIVRLPNGEAYDKDGCVLSATNGTRQRVSKSLTTLNLADDVFVAVPEAACVAGWLHVTPVAKENSSEGTDNTDGSDSQASPSPSLTSYQPATLQASDWDKAIEYIATRPLESLKLKADKIEAARTLATLAQPLAAASLTMTVQAGGTLKDGGEVQFLAEGVKIGHAIKPLDQAAMFLRAMDESTASLEATLTATFDSSASMDVSKLQKAKSDAADGVTIEAKFGKAVDA